MKLQKQSSRKKEDPNYEKYIKWVLVIPTDRIKQLGWEEGQEIKEEIKGNNLIITPIKQANNSESKEKILYEEFRDSIKNLLQRHPSGLTWTQIRDILKLPQKVPNNIWVNKMKKDIGLEQIKIEGDLLWNFEYDSIYTIGYEGYTLDKFIKKLKDSNIQQLIDVREIALSRKNGFSKSALKDALNKQGIRYEHLQELGSPKEIRHKLMSSNMSDEDYKKFFEEYKNHINDEDVMNNISVIEGLAKRKKSVIMCFEKNYNICHRSIIAEELKRRGWKVNHL